MRTAQEHGEDIASTLRWSATCTVLVPLHMVAEELFQVIRDQVRCFGIISRTGNTLHLAVVTENPAQFGNNQRINLRTTLAMAARVQKTEPERVWT